MNDRRLLLAMALVVLIAYLPLSWARKRQAAEQTPPAIEAILPDSGTAAPTLVSALPLLPDTLPQAPEDTVVVRSPLYEYAFSTRGGAVLSARMLRYRSLEERTRNDTLEMVPAGRALFGGRLVIGADTLPLDQIAFTPSTDRLELGETGGTLTMRGSTSGYTIDLTWTFYPDDYHYLVSGQVTGFGSIGATLLLDLGNGFRDTEANVAENHRESGIVTKFTKSELRRFSSFTPLETEQLAGPFEWVAVKSKYFVAGLFASDSTALEGARGRIASVRVRPADTLPDKPIRAEAVASLNVPAQGGFAYQVYLGPMEYDRLTAMGYSFDDVNPYGFAWIRGIVRPFAVAIRGVFLGMKNTLGIGFGAVIILFGVMVRLLLWPLNQKAMRSMTAMQAIQPQLQALQERYKQDPQRLQQEMFKIYREHKVNPLGGCWPMLLPYPFLVAVFFVLQNTIELRGESFLWMPDLSRMDPTFIIPILMAVSMFGMSWVAQRGMAPNQQAKMMMYLMPAIFLAMFWSFASGLNLYYLTQNLASIPQQLLINRERRALMEAQQGGGGRKVEVRTKA